MASRSEPGEDPAVEAVGRADAVRLTEQPRAATGEARRAAVAVAQRVRDARRARVAIPLGYSGGWGEYAQAELGIGRAQAYRLIAIAESAEGLSRAIGVAGVLTTVSPAGDTGATGVIDLGLSQRALREVTAGSMDRPPSSPSGSPQQPKPGGLRGGGPRRRGLGGRRAPPRSTRPRR
ncbi:hypothetical protein ACWZEH_15155 [Streptomyces sp. QTS137]